MYETCLQPLLRVGGATLGRDLLLRGMAETVAEQADLALERDDARRHLRLSHLLPRRLLRLRVLRQRLLRQRLLLGLLLLGPLLLGLPPLLLLLGLLGLLLLLLLLLLRRR